MPLDVHTAHHVAPCGPGPSGNASPCRTTYHTNVLRCLAMTTGAILVSIFPRGALGGGEPPCPRPNPIMPSSHASHASHARPEVLSGLFCVVVAIATVLTAWNVRTAAICRRDVQLAPLGVPTSRPAERPSQGLLGAVVMGAHVFSSVLELAHTPQTHLPFSPPQNFQKSKRAEFWGFLRGWCARSEL